ncbi:MAG TPA: hypothetical protein VE994_05915, partial [Terriglobales bacterium]|nr:hypothetical protein [Terriglobales bacterium]
IATDCTVIVGGTAFAFLCAAAWVENGSPVPLFAEVGWPWLILFATFELFWAVGTVVLFGCDLIHSALGRRIGPVRARNRQW